MRPLVYMKFVGRRARSHWSMLTVVSLGVVAAVVTIAASVIYFDTLGDIALTREIAKDTSPSHDIVITGRQRNFDAASNRRVLALVESTVDEFASSIVTDLTVAYGSPTLLIESVEQRVGVAPESSDRASWRAVLINAPGLRSGSVLTAGAWPSAEAGEGGPGQLTIEAAIDEVAAEAFGISVGDVVVVAPF